MGVYENISEEDITKNFIDFFKLRYVPLYCKDDKVLVQVYNSQGIELGKIKYCIEDLINQFFINTATWGLDLWEEDFGIKTNYEEDYEIRRKRLIAKKRGNATSTKQQIERVAMSFLNDDDKAECIPHNEEYYFDLYLNSEHGFPKEMEDLYWMVDEIKPAHLESRYHLRAITKTDLRIVSYGITGEEIRVYPVIINDIVSKAEIPVKFSQDKSIEKISVYPIISGVLVTEDDKEIVIEYDNTIKINN